MGRQAVRLLQSGRIGHAADGRDCPACAVVGEAVVRIGADGAGYAGSVEREIEWEDYAGRNFIKCQPGTLTKLDDGQMYRCQ